MVFILFWLLLLILDIDINVFLIKNHCIFAGLVVGIYFSLYIGLYIDTKILNILKIAVLDLCFL